MAGLIAFRMAVNSISSPFDSPSMRSGSGQIAYPDQIVGCQSEGKHPTNSSSTAMAGLAQAADGLYPAEDFFHAFAFLLTDRVAAMTRGAFIDDAGLLAR